MDGRGLFTVISKSCQYHGLSEFRYEINGPNCVSTEVKMKNEDLGLLVGASFHYSEI